MSANGERIALFLGAGASKAFSAPVTNEILPIIIERARHGALFDNRKQNDAVIDLLRGLMPGIAGVDQRYVLITEILSLIDYMLLSAFVPAPMVQAQQLHDDRMLLDHAILKVLTGIIDRTDDKATPPELARLAKWLYDAGNSNSVALISTNYDEIIEHEFYKCFIQAGKAAQKTAGVEDARDFDHVNYNVNFGISWRDNPTGRVFNPPLGYRHSVLKLHGSVDWVKCDLCGWIVCNDEYFSRNEPYHSVAYNEKSPSNTCNCGHYPLRPVMIAPSLVRDIRDINILSVWKSAFEELRTADQWFMIGYSLPIDDYALRSMMIRALKARCTPPKIDVYQWGNNPETEARYRAFFGESCEYYTDGMHAFISRVVDAEASAITADAT